MKTQWWKNAVGYQINPRSFYDSNEDGIGDLRGIIEKLDYIENLGVDCVWICPFYRSPMDDNGYDVSDFYDVDPIFGNIDDARELIHKAHLRGIHIIPGSSKQGQASIIPNAIGISGENPVMIPKAIAFRRPIGRVFSKARVGTMMKYRRNIISKSFRTRCPT
jgi:hypothetical protein